MLKKHIFLSGRVQGVGFRHFTRKNAESLGVKGWVRNLPDGRVEAEFQGDESDVLELIERCKKGPVAAYVQKIDVKDSDQNTDFSEFTVEL